MHTHTHTHARTHALINTMSEYLQDNRLRIDLQMSIFDNDSDETEFVIFKPYIFGGLNNIPLLTNSFEYAVGE